MRTEYKRDMNHNYMVIQEEEKIKTDSYQIRMLLGNNIPSLIKCRIQSIDDSYHIYYDITSKQSIADLYEGKKLQHEDLRLIFGSFVQVADQLSEYLLDPAQILLWPEYMYADVEKNQIYFCYYPGKPELFSERFKKFTEYMLPMIDHQDAKAVMLGYGIYRRVLEDTFQLNDIKEELYASKEIQQPENQPIMTEEERVSSQHIFDEYEESTQEISEKKIRLLKENTEEYKDEINQEWEKEKKAPIVWKILLGGIGVLVATVWILLKAWGFLPEIEVEILLSVITAGIGIFCLLYTIVKHAKGKKTIVSEKTRTANEIKQDMDSYFQEEQVLPKKEKAFFRKADHISEEYGETLVLCESDVTGPATLVSREPGELATIYLQEEMTIIGKLETAVDAVINIPTVSRVHAKIRKREGEYYLSDLNSRNGTSVNGQLLKEEYQLQNQDEVDFAQARYVFLK